jgi:hypothetical protein
MNSLYLEQWFRHHYWQQETQRKPIKRSGIERAEIAT